MQRRTLSGRALIKSAKRTGNVRTEWQHIRDVISHVDFNDKLEANDGFHKMRQLEPLAPYNRLRAAEVLIRARTNSPVTKKSYESNRRRLGLALRILANAREHFQAHPHYDNNYVRVLVGLGNKNLALTIAQKAARKWKKSLNMQVLADLYTLLGQKQRGDR